MSFLDINIILDAKGQLTTDLYTKCTDTHQYLHWNSCHLQYCKSTIPYSQALLICCICSGSKENLTRVSELKSHQVIRGYDETSVRHIDKATNIARSVALKKKETEPARRVPTVVTYHPDLPPLNKFLQNYLPTLHVSEKMQLPVPSPPLVANHPPHN